MIAQSVHAMEYISVRVYSDQSTSCARRRCWWRALPTDVVDHAVAVEGEDVVICVDAPPRVCHRVELCIEVVLALVGCVRGVSTPTHAVSKRSAHSCV